MTNEEWNKLRIQLNHDWLPKKFLNFLGAWANTIDGMVARGERLPENVRTQFQAFFEKQDEIYQLIDAAEGALSPRQLIDRDPLHNLSEDNKEWLRVVVHTLYCDRTRIHDRVLELKEVYLDICECYIDLLEALEGKKREQTEIGGSFVVFGNKVSHFSRLISSLPYKIQVLLLYQRYL